MLHSYEITMYLDLMKWEGCMVCFYWTVHFMISKYVILTYSGQEEQVKCLFVKSGLIEVLIVSLALVDHSIRLEGVPRSNISSFNFHV